MARSRKVSSNSVLLILAKEDDLRVVARFDSGPEGDGEKATPARTKANAYIQAVLENEEHELHSDLKAYGFELWNDSPSHVKPRMALTF